jgi:hypothetical protein
LAQAHLIGMHRLNATVAMRCNLVSILRRQRFDGLDDIGNQRRKRDGDARD